MDERHEGEGAYAVDTTLTSALRVQVHDATDVEDGFFASSSRWALPASRSATELDIESGSSSGILEKIGLGVGKLCTNSFSIL